MRCKKCGSDHVNKSGTYTNKSNQTYARFRCMACKAVEYVPMDNRPSISWKDALEGLRTGAMRVWFNGKAWKVATDPMSVRDKLIEDGA